MTIKEFIACLKSIDGKFRLIPGGGHVSGLYKFWPKHQDAFNGLVWVGACPSPSAYHSLPPKDWFDSKGRYNRGWMTIVSLLVKNKWISESQAKKEFGSDWKVPGIRGELSIIPGWNEKQGMEKANEKLAALGKEHGVRFD